LGQRFRKFECELRTGSLSKKKKKKQKKKKKTKKKKQPTWEFLLGLCKGERSRVQEQICKPEKTFENLIDGP